jgi:Fe-S cluster assembly iron-binding protein IscA
VTTVVNVTERARERLKALRETAIDDASVGLRLETTSSGEFGVFPDRKRADDQIVEHQGAVVLLVGQEIAEQVENTTIDYDESEPGPRLVIKRS